MLLGRLQFFLGNEAEVPEPPVAVPAVDLDGSTQYLRRVAPAGIGLGPSNNLIFGAWVRLTDLTTVAGTSHRVILSQSDLTGDQRSWQVRASAPTQGGTLNRFVVVMSSNGLANTNTFLDFNPPATIAAGEWYFLMGGWDSSGAVIRARAASVSSGGTAATPLAFANGPFAGSAALRIGAIDSAEQWKLFGRVQMAFVANPPDLGASDFNDLFELLWNEGNGRTHNNLTTSERAALGLVSWFPLSGSPFNDAIGSNDLTAFGSPDVEDGHVVQQETVWSFGAIPTTFGLDVSVDAVAITSGALPTVFDAEAIVQPVAITSGVLPTVFDAEASLDVVAIAAGTLPTTFDLFASFDEPVIQFGGSLPTSFDLDATVQAIPQISGSLPITFGLVALFDGAVVQFGGLLPTTFDAEATVHPVAIAGGSLPTTFDLTATFGAIAVQFGGSLPTVFDLGATAQPISVASGALPTTFGLTSLFGVGPQVLTAELASDGVTLTVTFDREIEITGDPIDGWIVSADGSNRPVETVILGLDERSIVLTVAPPIFADQTVLLSYQPEP